MWGRQGISAAAPEWALHQFACQRAGRGICLTVAIRDGQSLKTTRARGGVRGFDAHPADQRPRASLPREHARPALRPSRVEPAGVSHRVAGRRLLGGRRFAFPGLRIIIADVGHESRKLAAHLQRCDSYTLQMVRRRPRAFQVRDPPGSPERSGCLDQP